MTYQLKQSQANFFKLQLNKEFESINLKIFSILDSNDTDLINGLPNWTTDTISSHIELLKSLCIPHLKPLLDRHQKVDAALCQFEIGLYGICADCESPIRVCDLESDPAEQRCKHCR